MDKKKEEGRWSWLPTAMPGVARLMADKRRQLGDGHVAECWRQGVVHQLPGWFFAREGALAVGTPWPDIADVAGWQVTRTQALVIMRDPAAVAPAAAGVSHGA